MEEDGGYCCPNAQVTCIIDATDPRLMVHAITATGLVSVTEEPRRAWFH